jgi:tetratricopeptide (TPR) repeat protein
MARRTIFFVIAIAVPLISLLIHPELRRILLWDAIILTFKPPSQAMNLLPKPVDPLAQAIEKAEMSQGKERWLEYERLYRETGEVWLGVFGLRYGMDVVRSAVPSEEQAVRPQKPSPEDAQKVLKLATELSERDKDNAFPLLVKAYALFALGRDDEALKTFHEAVLRPAYRTYEDKWLKLKVSRDLTAEERLSQAFAILFPHLSHLRELARRVMKYSVEAEEKGDFGRALRLAEDVLRLGAKLREQGFSVIESMVGIAIQSIAFAGEKRKLTPTEERRLSAHPTVGAERIWILACRFAEFARQANREDLAEWALKEGEESARVRNFLSRYLLGEVIILPFKERDGRRLVNTRLTGFALLLSSLMLAIIALLSSAFLWKATIPVDRYSPITATLIVAGLPVAAILWGLMGAVKVEFWKATKDQTYFATIYLPFATLLLLFAVCFLPALWQFKGRVDRRTIAVLIGIPAFAGALTILAVNTPVSAVSSAILSVLLLLSLIGIVVVVWWLKGKLDAPSFFVRIASSVALAVTVFVLLGVVFLLLSVLESFRWQWRSVEAMPLFLIAALTVSAFVFFIAWGIWARFGHPERRQVCQGALARLKGAAVLLFLICWWGYAIVGFGSLPLRAKLHSAIDNLIAHGEMALLQQQAKMF